MVQDAFIAGGSQVGLAHDDEDRWELQNYSTWTKGRHILRFGVRVRGVKITDFSPQNFGGTFTFSGGKHQQLDANNQIVLDDKDKPVLIPITSIERFRRTLLFQGNPDMRALGGGVTQFSLAGGNPEASVSQTDLGAFVQDEWRIRPNLTFTMGLRYERQTNISSNYNFAPRLFFAWAPGGTSVGSLPGAPSSSSSPKMVIRGGMGVFYDRFGERATLLANRFNGVNQLDFRVFDPATLDLSTFSLDGVTNVPTIESLAAFASPQIVRRIAPDFQAPTFVMTAINFERQLPAKFTLFLVGFNYRGKHLLRVRNINAPLPGTYDPENPDTAFDRWEISATFTTTSRVRSLTITVLWWREKTDEQRLLGLCAFWHRQREDGYGLHLRFDRELLSGRHLRPDVRILARFVHSQCKLFCRRNADTSEAEGESESVHRLFEWQAVQYRHWTRHERRRTVY